MSALRSRGEGYEAKRGKAGLVIGNGTHFFSSTMLVLEVHQRLQFRRTLRSDWTPVYRTRDDEYEVI